MSEKVFVYGTLRTGDCRHGVESFMKMVAPEAYVQGFEMLDLGGFPGLIPFEGENAEGLPRIRGEVHEYEHLGILDRIEGYQENTPTLGLYNRVQVTVETPDGEIEDVWVYIFNGAPDLYRCEIIQSGDWFEHRGYYEQLEATGIQ